MASITCGQCKGTHTSVADVRRCHEGMLTVCLVPVLHADGWTGNCGADAHDGPDGVVCTAGHDETYDAEARDGEPLTAMDGVAWYRGTRLVRQYV